MTILLADIISTSVYSFAIFFLFLNYIRVLTCPFRGFFFILISVGYATKDLNIQGLFGLFIQRRDTISVTNFMKLAHWDTFSWLLELINGRTWNTFNFLHLSYCILYMGKWDFLIEIFFAIYLKCSYLFANSHWSLSPGCHHSKISLKELGKGVSFLLCPSNYFYYCYNVII